MSWAQGLANENAQKTTHIRFAPWGTMGPNRRFSARKFAIHNENLARTR